MIITIIQIIPSAKYVPSRGISNDNNLLSDWWQLGNRLMRGLGHGDNSLVTTWWQFLVSLAINKGLQPSSPVGNVYHLLKAIIWWSEHVAFSVISRGTNRDIFASNVSNFWKQYPGAWNWVHPQVILKCENLSLQLQRNPITRKPWSTLASWWPWFSWPNIFAEK